MGTIAGTGALLLNATYEPLRVIPLKRAVVLVLSQKAEVIEMGNGEVRSASSSFPIPSVIRLTKWVKVPYRTRIPLNRQAVLNRDGGVCQYCGGKANTMDHVHPRSRGGAHRWENVVAACGPCNAKKDSKTLGELGWSLSSKPYAPKGTAWLILGLATMDPGWEPYLGLQTA